MTIDSITSRLHSSTSTTKSNPKSAIDNDKASTAGKIHGDRIDITSSAARINEALESASSSPVVDNKRVAAIKQALANGSYTIDAEKIAQKMTHLDSLSNQNST